MRKEEPPRYARAVRFCRTCHGGADAPSRASRPSADAAFTQTSSEHHIELDHLAHTARTTCRYCHVVDPQSLRLVEAAPGHAQCAGCHGAAATAPTTTPAARAARATAPGMERCATCHSAPAPAAYFKAARPDSDVRSCGSAAHRALESGGKGPVPCFKHERVEHRGPQGSPLECAGCHFMIADRARWGSFAYRTLAELKAAPIIHNRRDEAHASCGAGGCHTRDVDDARGTARCKLCHSSKVVEESIFD
jgi:hypothetical protein